MAGGVVFKPKRKAGAFSGGDLEAGEVGLDTVGGVWYWSSDGASVTALSNPGGGENAFTSEQEAASSAGLTFPLGEDAKYSFTFLQLLPASDLRSLHVYVSDDDGATFEASDYMWIGDGRNGGSQNYSNGFANITAGAFIGNDTNEVGLSGELTIYDPSSSGRVLMNWHVVFIGNDGYIKDLSGGGVWNGGDGPITHLRFEMNSGAISSGKIGMQSTGFAA